MNRHEGQPLLQIQAWHQRRLPGLALVLIAGLLAYANIGAGAFQFDDFAAIVENPRVHGFAAWVDGVAAGSPRPLLSFTYLLCWLAGDGSPFPFHLFNLVLHLFNAVLVALVAHRFLERVAPGPSTWPCAVLTAALFAVHPVHTEAITYICGRSTSLMNAFYLLALWWHDEAGTPGQCDHRPRVRRLAMLAYLGAVLSKEAGMCLPCALVLWDVMTGLTWPHIWRRVRPYLMLTALFGLAAMLHAGYGRMLDNMLHKRDWIANLDAQARATLVLLATVLLPWHLNLDPDWGLAGWSVEGVTATLFILISCAVAWRMRRTQPVLAFAVAWLALHLYLPHLLFPRGDVANERQLYWADWPVFLAIAAWLHQYIDSWAVRAGTLALILVLCALSLERNRLYADPVLLWQETARMSPDKPRVFNNLGYALQLAGRADEARTAFERALQLDPDSVRARNNLERLDQGVRE